ncbi:phage DNA helicase [Enterococcus sp. AZ008]
MKAMLHPYQEYSKNFILDHPYCGLLLDMGL